MEEIRQTQSNKPLTIFFERVTIQGFEEIQKATKPRTRLFWLAIIFLAFGCFIRDAWHLLAEMTAVQTSVKYDWNLIEKPFGLRLPNVTVCAQTDFNKSRVNELFYVSPKILESKTAVERNLTKEKLINDFIIYYSPNMRERKIDSAVERLIQQIFADPINKNISGDTSRLIQTLMPSCQAMMGECIFDGKIFPCCDFALFTQFDGYACYKLALDVNSDHQFIQTKPGSAFGLTFTSYLDRINIPFRDAEDEMIDGFMINVKEEATVFSENPIASWPGSHVDIMINGRRKISRTKCQNNDDTDLEYFDHYDPNGVFCSAELMIKQFGSFLNCIPPGFGYLPNATIACDATFFPLLGKANGMNLDTALLKMINENGSPEKMYLVNTMKSKLEKIFGSVNPDNLLNHWRRSGACRPLCKKWDHRLTVSYSGLQHAPDIWDSDSTNAPIGMTKISVFYGELAYEEIQEQAKVEIYTLFSAVGGLAGFYTGASIITFVQLIAFGLWCSGKNIKNRKRNMKVAPAPGGV